MLGGLGNPLAWVEQQGSLRRGEFLETCPAAVGGCAGGGQTGRSRGGGEDARGKPGGRGRVLSGMVSGDWQDRLMATVNEGGDGEEGAEPREGTWRKA